MDSTQVIEIKYRQNIGNNTLPVFSGNPVVMNATRDISERFSVFNECVICEVDRE